MALLRSPEPRPRPKTTLSIRIEVTLRGLLDRYCEFAKCGRQHIVQEALKLAFEQDAEFQHWLEAGRETAVTEREACENAIVQHRSS